MRSIGTGHQPGRHRHIVAPNERVNARGLLWLALAALLVAACDWLPVGPGPDNGFDDTDVVVVTARTTGASLDADGYSVRFADEETRSIGLVQTIRLPTPREDGVYDVELTGVAPNCDVVGANPHMVVVVRGRARQPTTMFEVECAYVERDIAFASDRGGTVQIYTMGSDGSYPVRLRLMADPADGPAWSPRGHRIAFHQGRPGQGQILVTGALGLDIRSHFDGDGDIAWSPDGGRIAFRGPDFWFGFRSILWIVDADGRNPLQLTDEMSADPAWSPDGARIAFTSGRSGNDEIYVIDADGSNPRQLTDHAGRDSGAAWSPDGTSIAFHSDRDGDFEIYVMHADGSNPVRLTRHAADDFGPVWSPDGARIAFTTDRDGNQEIYLMNADGSNPINLTNHPAADREPSWSSSVNARSF